MKRIAFIGAVAFALCATQAAPAATRFLHHKHHMTLRERVSYFQRSVNHESHVYWHIRRSLGERPHMTPQVFYELRWHRHVFHWHYKLLRRYGAKLNAKRVTAYGAPAWFTSQALCVHSHEGSWTDSGDPYWGGMQFALSTWARAGGTGLPSAASPSEQIYRAYRIYVQDGGSWREWPNTARMCGLL